MDDLRTVTTVAASSLFEQDRLWLNGNEENPAENKRVQRVLREIRKRAKEDIVVENDAGETITVRAEWPENLWRTHYIIQHISNCGGSCIVCVWVCVHGSRFGNSI